MAKVDRDLIPGRLLSRHYTNNGAQLITGQLGNAMFQEIVDSSVWYDERFKSYVFPYELESVVTTPPPTTTGLYYIQRFDTSGVGIYGNVIYNDIVEFDAGMWKKVAVFDETKDWIVYTKGVSDDSKGTSWIYSKLDTNSVNTDRGEWYDIGEQKLTPHNYASYKQGGTTDEYYHLTAAQHANLGDIGNTIIVLDTREVKEVISYGSFPSVPVPSAYYLFETAAGSGEWDLKMYNGSTYPSATTTENTYIYSVDDKHIYEYDKTSATHVDVGIFKHSVHNNQKDLQGGTSGEYYHLTQAEYSSLTVTSDFNYFTYLIKEVSTSIPALTITPGVDDYVVINNAAATQGCLIYKYSISSGSWVLQPALTERTYIVNNIDQEVWVFNPALNLFSPKGKHILAFHNNIQGIQGGYPTERYHVNQGIYDNLDEIEYSVNVYIDPISGDDTNNGATSGSPVKTSNRLATVLQYRNIVELTINHINPTSAIVTFTITGNLEAVLDKNEYLDELTLQGVLGTSEVKDYSVAASPTTLLLSATTFANDYYSYRGVNIFKTNSGFIDDTSTPTKIVSIPSNFTIGGAQDNNLIVSRFVFNQTNNDSVRYKLKVNTAILTSNKTYFSRLSVRSNSVFINASSYLVDVLIVNNGMLDGGGTGVCTVITGLFSKLTLEKTDLTVNEKMISDDGGFVNNASFIKLSKGAKFIYNGTGDAPLTLFNNISDIFELNQNSTLEMHHGPTTKVTFLMDTAGVEVLKLIQKGVSTYIDAGSTLYTNSSLTEITAGIVNSDFYENESNEIKILLSNITYLEAKQMEYIPAQSLTSTAVQLLKISDITAVTGFIANVYFENDGTGSGTSGEIYLKTWHVFYDNATSAVTATALTGSTPTLTTLDEAVMFIKSGTEIIFQGKSSVNVSCNISIEITRFF